jgi:hypothetical protein
MKNLGALLLLPLVSLACIQEEEETLGEVSLAVAAPTDVARVRVSATTYPNTMTPRIVELTKVNGSWTGSLPTIPTGQTLFVATAWNAAGTVTYTGDVFYDVPARPATAMVALILQSTDRTTGDFTNHAPYIRSYTVSDLSIEPGQTVSVAVDAKDDDNEALTYWWSYITPEGWSEGDGLFANRQAASTTFTAPATGWKGGKLEILVVDPRNQYTSARAGVGVSQTGSATITATFNSAPRIGNLTGTFNADTDPTHAYAQVSAYDPDGDPLSVQWGNPGCGTAVNSGAQSSVTLNASATSCTFRAYVYDAQGMASEATLTLSVVPPVLRTAPEVFEQSIFIEPMTGASAVYVWVHVRDSLPTATFSTTVGSFTGQSTFDWEGINEYELGATWLLPACFPGGLATATVTVTGQTGLVTVVPMTMTGDTCP